MLRCPLPLLAVVLCGGLAAACSSAEDTAAPVASAAVTLDRAAVAVGSPVDMTYTFTVAPDAPAFGADYHVFVHFVDEAGEQLWTDDHLPPTPTSQWRPGATIRYTRTMFTPKAPNVGATRVLLGLYDHTTGDRLPLSGTAAGARAYEVATFDMRPPNDALIVVFKEGWHTAESSPDAAGLEWQWSMKDASLAFRNPGRDVTLLLDVDEPLVELTPPQQVEVAVGGTVVDAFTVPSGERLLRRVPLSPTQMGPSETVDVTLSVARTFVPASQTAGRTADTRELGIRVFHAYLQPK